MNYFRSFTRFKWTKEWAKHFNLTKRSDTSQWRASLEKSSEDGLLEEDEYKTDWRRGRFPWITRRVLITSHLILAIIYAVILITVLRDKSRSCRLHGLPVSPAIEALQWENQEFPAEDKIHERGAFSGKPSPELDRAWHDLLNAENIMVEPEYMKRLGRENMGVRIPDGTGYIGTLNVYHELHCLKRIHQFMYYDHYFPNGSAEQFEMNRLHNEHCIDFLRRSSMCHGDIGLITFEWIKESRIPVAHATSHQCVNWDRLDRWTQARTVDMMKPGWLVHPSLGLAYPDGKGDKIGAVVVSKNH